MRRRVSFHAIGKTFVALLLLMFYRAVSAFERALIPRVPKVANQLTQVPLLSIYR